MKSTTDLNLLREGFPFTWGKINEIIDVGPYTIIRAQPYIDLPQGEYSSLDKFYIYIRSIDHGLASSTLDGALALCIAKEHDGLNSQAAHYFLRMIGAPIDE